MVIDVNSRLDLRLDLRLLHFFFGHADFLVTLWMAILRLR